MYYYVCCTLQKSKVLTRQRLLILLPKIKPKGLYRHVYMYMSIYKDILRCMGVYTPIIIIDPCNTVTY